MSYTSLHGHSDFSNIRLLDCISKPEQIIDRGFELGLKGVAITDHESLSSFVRAEQYLKKKRAENEEWNNFKFIRGNEIYLCRNGLSKDNYVRGEDRFFHFILLAKDAVGYEQLCELSSRAWKRSYKHFQMRVPTYYQDLIDVVGKNPGHLITSSACLGSFLGNQILNAEAMDKAMLTCEAWIGRIKEIVGSENFYLELQPGVSKEQKLVDKALVQLSEMTDTPCIITTDHHYTKKEDRGVHKAYLNSKNGEREVDEFYEATYMMDRAEIHERMDSIIGAERVDEFLDNTNIINERIEDFSLLRPLQIPYLPKERFDIDDSHVEETYCQEIKDLPNIIPYIESEEKANHQFAARILQFMRGKDTPDAPYRWTIPEKVERMNMELGIIWDSSVKMNVDWSKYFLQVSDYINIYWTDGDSLICPSRGSAGASYVCFALGIIQIDPTRESAPLIFQRFMNPDRASVLDIDIDVQSNRRGQCITALERVYGKDHTTRVSTFKTEKSRSAILTAARAIGMDVDTARYISSLIGAERGIQYTLKQMYYGDEENLLKPNKTFIEQMDKYPMLWEIAWNIEGLVSGLGSHAGGVIITEDDIVKHCGVMKTSSGDIVTAYDLHEAEELSLIKIDLLATEGLSKIRACLDLLCEYGYVKREATLRETYEKVLGVYNLEREDINMWKMVWNNEIVSLFQMEQQSGIQGIALTKPSSLEDLATLNSVIRLMPPDKKAERPLEKYARFREENYLWDQEMDEAGLTKEEKEMLHEMFDYSCGISAQQEDLYQLMRSDKIVGYSFGQADKLRKCIAKKNPKDYQAFEEQFWKDVAEKGSSKNLCEYIWNTLVATQRGYSFNLAHTLSYSIVALQEMNLAYFYPIIFWNTANLIVDSGADYKVTFDDEEGEDSENEEDGEKIDEYEAVSEEEEKKSSSSKYGKIASAIGRMQQIGIKVLPPDINESRYTYTPNTQNNTIRYGLTGIVKVGAAIVQEILDKRPYSSINDFLTRVKVNKTQMVNLIKCGAFDCFGNREQIMDDYLFSISGAKTNLTLQNANMLIQQGLIPDSLDFERKVFNFNKYLRKFKDKATDMIELDETAMEFYQKHFNMDVLKMIEDKTYINATTWKNTYDKYMDNIRKYIIQNKAELLKAINKNLIDELYEKYAQGTLARWSMDSVCFYQDGHELDGANLRAYGIVDFNDLPEEPEIDYSFSTKEGYIVNMFKLHRIAGTVIDKDKNKSQVALLTPTGVVTVQAYGIFAQYDKQLREEGTDGKMHVVEKSMFTRGNKVVVLGMRRGPNTFVAKKYRKMVDDHHFMQITNVNEDGSLELKEKAFD